MGCLSLIHIENQSPLSVAHRKNEVFSNSSTVSYRYGFNGKELDPEGMGGGGSTYDYGFRIYNAQLGKFLSVDPLSGTYPMYTPYQFAANMPIAAVDVDGLEAYITINSPWFTEEIKKAVSCNDIERAKMLAWKATTTMASDEYAMKVFDGVWAGSVSENPFSGFISGENPLAVIVKDGDGNEILRYNRPTPKEQIKLEVQDASEEDLFDWSQGNSNNTELEGTDKDHTVRKATAFQELLKRWGYDPAASDDIINAMGKTTEGGGSGTDHVYYEVDAVSKKVYKRVVEYTTEAGCGRGASCSKATWTGRHKVTNTTKYDMEGNQVGETLSEFGWPAKKNNEYNKSKPSSSTNTTSE